MLLWPGAGGLTGRSSLTCVARRNLKWVLGGLACALLVAIAVYFSNPEWWLGWPRLELTLAGGYELARTSVTIDRDGRLVREGRGDDGGGTIHETTCTGALAPEVVRPWFERVAAVPQARAEWDRMHKIAGANRRAKGAIVNEHFTIVLATTSEARTMPADDEAYVALRDEAFAWFEAAMRASEANCVRSVRRP